MNKTSYLLLALIVSSLTLGTAYALQAGLSFDEFCDTKTTNNKTSAADFICEVDIFQMKDDVEYLKSLTIPDYDKIPIVHDVNFYFDSDLGLTHADYMAQVFYNKSTMGMKLFEDGILITETIERQSLGLDKYNYDSTHDNWADGTVLTLQILGNSKIIFEEEIIIVNTIQ